MSTYQIRAMSVGDILDTAVAVYRSYFGTLISVAIVCLGLPALMSIYVDIGGGATTRPGLWFLSRVLAAIGNIVAGGAVVWVVSEGYLDREPGAGDAIAAAFARFGKLFVSGLAKYIVIGLAFIALVVPAIIVACGYAVVVQVVMLEPISAGTDALGRSWSLTKHFKGKAFVLGLVMLALILLPSMAAGALAAIVPGFGPVMLVLGEVLQLIFLPASACVFTLFYYDLRVRKEAFDLEQLSARLGGAELAGA